MILGAHDVGEQGGPLRLRAVVIEATAAFGELGFTLNRDASCEGSQK
jgi:hypothetical protein